MVAKAAEQLDPTTEVTWGRRAKANRIDGMVAACIVAFVPFWMYMNNYALHYHGGSLYAATDDPRRQGILALVYHHLQHFSVSSLLAYLGWVAFQAALYAILPGRRCLGQRTPGGQLLEYTVNGLLAWSITHGLFAMAIFTGTIRASIIADHWQSLIVAADVYGILVSVAAMSKGYFAPTHAGDRKLSGSLAFDFFSGVELNPRFGKYFDVKFFHNGRPGIVAWTLINFSCAAHQYDNHGYVSNSMIIVNILQAIYVLDFFVNEDWYLRTVDITHDHFGFYLAYGTASFLPKLYTIQAQYLAVCPTHLSTAETIGTLSLGLAGYALFRSANHQKDIVRRTQGAATIWGKPAQAIRAEYYTSDGKKHTSLLLAGGWWGVCRHTNYLADLIQTLAMSLTCGFNHFLPWSHFVWMCALLLNRLVRDERRCRNKYGEKWDEYCEKVPYRLIPGVW
ncbi:7-dehydrocholesterol reductase [Pseudocercospora fuligena]|uniref:7-dehydrocholesterol reductase n=1 Tax=Pseudocercospora fuligena TaxID=685502 RepID=A0A8H6VHF6_9PEZI|nr:7-dehydrocholesterol reductase [Pseudocercospora fuligena]